MQIINDIRTYLMLLPVNMALCHFLKSQLHRLPFFGTDFDTIAGYHWQPVENGC